MNGIFKMKMFVPVIIIVIFVSCAVNPVTGKHELMLLSEQDEIQMGKQTDPEIVQMYGVYDDPQLASYISSIGMKMARLSHRPNLPYEFKVMDSPIINAFAVPGGYIYFTRGILAYLNSEAEVAGVMGHEIGHVTAKHTAKQYSKAQVTQLGLGLGAALSESFRQYAGIAQFGVGLLFLKFSRDHERQSDQLGVEYSTKAGYDATHMAHFFQTLDQMQSGSDGGGLPGWFSTHPNPADRVGAVKSAARDWQQRIAAKNLTVGRDDYLRNINGLVFGNDPRQGYVENSVFYHPELRFQFPVPSGWNLNNTPSQVQMISPEEDAVIIFGIESGASPAAVANKFQTSSKATVISSESVNVNGLSAQRLVSDITSQDGVLRVLSFFIQKDNNIYVFHGFTAQTAFSNYESAFQNTMSRFQRLTDQSKINVRPDRIRIKQATRGGTIKDALISAGVANDKLESTALLNGMKLTDSVPENMLIKIIEEG